MRISALFGAKSTDFSKFMMYPHGQGERGVELVRTFCGHGERRDHFFAIFCGHCKFFVRNHPYPSCFKGGFWWNLVVISFKPVSLCV